MEEKAYKYRLTTPEGYTLQTDDPEVVLRLLKVGTEISPPIPETRPLVGYIITGKGKAPFYDMEDSYVIEGEKFKRIVSKKDLSKINDFLRESSDFHDRKTVEEKLEMTRVTAEYGLLVLCALEKVRRVRRGRSYLYQTTFQPPRQIQRNSENLVVTDDKTKKTLETERDVNVGLAKEKRDWDLR